MKQVKKTKLVAILLLSTFVVYSQDVIYRLNPKKEIKCKVLEIGDEQIRYRSSEFSDSLTFNIDTKNVTKIIFANGKEFVPQSGMYDKESYENQHKNAVKFSFTSPLMGYTGLGYERSIRPGQSVDLGLGLIGVGWDFANRNPSGLSLRAGYKFITSPDYYSRRMLYSHLLKGWYAEPEISFVHYKSDNLNYDYYYGYGSGYYNNYSSSSRTSTTFVGLSVLFGKQWVFSDRFLIDLNIGFGYALGSFGNNNSTYHYGFSGASDDAPFNFTSAFRIGYLF
jgi:hypothetical protein